MGVEIQYCVRGASLVLWMNPTVRDNVLIEFLSSQQRRKMVC